MADNDLVKLRHQSQCVRMRPPCMHAELYVDKLQLADGMSVLELGCGWGSFTLFAVRSIPSCTTMDSMIDNWPIPSCTMMD